jgi:quercetin dioxygenase-like cupin family protein
MPSSTDAAQQAASEEVLARKGITRTEIQRSPISVPGREVVQVLTEISCGTGSGWHIHPGEEVGFLIAGTVKMEIAGRPTMTLHARDGFLIPPRVPHNATDLGPAAGLMLSTYLLEAGEPVLTLVDAPNDVA